MASQSWPDARTFAEGHGVRRLTAADNARCGTHTVSECTRVRRREVIKHGCFVVRATVATQIAVAKVVGQTNKHLTEILAERPSGLMRRTRRRRQRRRPPARDCFLHLHLLADPLQQGGSCSLANRRRMLRRKSFWRVEGQSGNYAARSPLAGSYAGQITP